MATFRTGLEHPQHFGIEFVNVRIAVRRLDVQHGVESALGEPRIIRQVPEFVQTA